MRRFGGNYVAESNSAVEFACKVYYVLQLIECRLFHRHIGTPGVYPLVAVKRRFNARFACSVKIRGEIACNRFAVRFVDIFYGFGNGAEKRVYCFAVFI